MANRPSPNWQEGHTTYIPLKKSLPNLGGQKCYLYTTFYGNQIPNHSFKKSLLRNPPGGLLQPVINGGKMEKQPLIFLEIRSNYIPGLQNDPQRVSGCAVGIDFC